ncbi:MAG TPA: nitroreductase [Chloroflexi bacterium]|nr:nitroreductase [Chloroflexota bacterium]
MKDEIGFWKVVDNRRSVRRFKDKPVDRSLLERVIQTGTRAPNAHNRQSWRFVVLTGKQDMECLAEEMGIDYRKALLESGFSPADAQERVEKRRQRLTGAPAVVVLCVDTADLNLYKSKDRSEGEYLMAVQSAALAGGHMLLAAQALGLAGVWMCAPLFTPKRVRSAFELPETWHAQGLLLLGYAAEAPEFRLRKPLSEVTRWV